MYGGAKSMDSRYVEVWMSMVRGSSRTDRVGLLNAIKTNRNQPQGMGAKQRRKAQRVEKQKAWELNKRSKCMTDDEQDGQEVKKNKIQDQMNEGDVHQGIYSAYNEHQTVKDDDPVTVHNNLSTKSYVVEEDKEEDSETETLSISSSRSSKPGGERMSHVFPVPLCLQHLLPEDLAPMPLHLSRSAVAKSGLRYFGPSPKAAAQAQPEQEKENEKKDENNDVRKDEEMKEKDEEEEEARMTKDDEVIKQAEDDEAGMDEDNNIFAQSHALNCMETISEANYDVESDSMSPCHSDEESDFGPTPQDDTTISDWQKVPLSAWADINVADKDCGLGLWTSDVEMTVNQGIGHEGDGLAQTLT